MRAKEYLELHKEDIYYYDIVKKSICELSPLRFDRYKTEEYFNRYLFADARNRADEKFSLREDEVDPAIALAVRIEMHNVIGGDETFVFAYNIIAEGRNRYANSDSMRLCDLKEESIHSILKIREHYKNYKEDYPKSVLSDYLLDSHNMEFYHRKNEELHHDKEWWLEVFNRAYEIFDEMRTQLERPYEAQFLISRLHLEDKDLQQAVVGVVCCLLEHYDFQLSGEQKRKLDMLWELVRDFSHNGNVSADSRNEIEALKLAVAEKDLEIASLQKSLADLQSQLSANQEEADRGGMTVSETSLVFYYLFNELGVDFSNSDKTQWARFIHRMTGKSFQSIRDSLRFDFDAKNTRKNLRNVSALFGELFPGIVEKILRDMAPLL